MESTPAMLVNSTETKNHPSWEITFDPTGKSLGLPETVSQKDVIVFLGHDNKWYAQKPSPELLDEIRLWRTDWKDI